MGKGERLIEGMTGVPETAALGTRDCALMVVPCGIEAMRQSVLVVISFVHETE